MINHMLVSTIVGWVSTFECSKQLILDLISKFHDSMVLVLNPLKLSHYLFAVFGSKAEFWCI